MNRSRADDSSAPSAGAEGAADPWHPVADSPLSHSDTSHRPAVVLGVVGDSGSGKNTVAKAVATLLGPERIAEVHLDDYHRFTREERARRGLTSLNPSVHNLALMQEHLRLLRQRRPIRNRTYRHADGSFGPIRTIVANDIVLARGRFGFPNTGLQKLYDLSIFLQPEPELLFRWKLRKDVQLRGYSETEVLKNIAAHLLDAKEFVVPQAERAHLHVTYSLPHPDAEDSEVRTTLRLRREAADTVRESDLFGSVPIRQLETDDEVVVEVPADLPQDAFDSWAQSHFSESYAPREISTCFGEDGVPSRSAPLGVVEVLIAFLTRRMMEKGER